MAKKSKKKKKLQKRHHFIESGQVAGSVTAHQPATSNSRTDTPAIEPERAESSPVTETNSDRAHAVAVPTGHSDKDTELAHKTQLMLHDAGKTAFIGGAIVIILFILWFAFEHTGLGATVYHLIRV